jgi:hypothetical protein
MRSLIVVGILVSAFSAVQAQPPCTQADLHAAAQRVKAIQTQLLAYKLKEDMDESVPPPLQANISAFKDALASLADAALQCTPASANPKLIESTLAKLLDANQPVKQEVYDLKKPPQLDQIYGGRITVKVTAPPKSPNLLLVEFRFDIECSFDSLLLVYETREGHRRQSLRWQSGNYDDVSGAFGDFFQYQVLPQGNSTDWLLVVGHGNPWCSSNMSGYHIDVLRPDGNVRPHALFHKDITYNRSYDPSMRCTADGFELRLEVYTPDTNIIFRPGVYRFHVTPTEFVRVQPIALNGRDFVDEWLKSPWSDAQAWIAPSASAVLKPIHEKINTLEDPNTKDPPSFTYGPVRTCTDSKAHFQVGLDEEWFENQQTRPDKPTYFEIQTGINSFTMLSASAQPDPHCTGPDIMAKH